MSLGAHFIVFAMYKTASKAICEWLKHRKVKERKRFVTCDMRGGKIFNKTNLYG